MTKEEYLASMRAFREEEYAARRKQMELENAYIAEHKQFNAGDKVLVTYKDGHTVEAFVTRFSIHEDGELYYGMRGMKKDGSMSLHRLPYYPEDRDKIELLEPAKN